MRIRNIWLAILGLLTAFPQFVRAADISDFADFSLISPRGPVLLPGRLFTPPEALADPSIARPLMVFLHGSGANGIDNAAQIAQTADEMLDEAKQRGAYLYVPQTATNWTSASTIDSVMTMINRAVTQKHADPARLYATGYSNGGGGVWNLLNQYPHHFAAALAVDGVAPGAGFNAANLLGTAVFALHARDDATVPVDRTRTIVNGILSAAGEALPNYAATPADQTLLVSNPHFQFDRDLADSAPPGSTVNFSISSPNLDLLYFESPNGDHTGLFGAFEAPPIYDWMFSHSLAVPEPSPVGMLIVALTLLGLRRELRAESRFSFLASKIAGFSSALLQITPTFTAATRGPAERYSRSLLP